jgi:signal transduction histidine kinase
MKRSRARFSAYGAFAAAILLFAGGLLVANFEDGVYRDQQVKNVTEQADILAASAAAAVAFDDASAAQEYVDALKVNPEMRAARVLDRAMRTLAHFSRAPEQGTEDIRVMEPVRQSGQVMGYVLLVASSEPAARRLTRYIGLLLLGTMGALMIAMSGIGAVILERRAGELARLNDRLTLEMNERARTEEALRQSQKLEAIGQLSGGIAHDFNNLIMIVRGNLGLLRKRLTADETKHQYLGAAEEALSRAASLTQRILAFARRQALSPRPLQLSELVREMEELIRHSLRESIAIQLDLEAEWWAACDANQLENVILNLTLNARDAMPAGGELRIATRDCRFAQPPPGTELLPGEYVRLTIADTGSGMSEEVRARAVDPFFTTKPLGKGTGLGLSMAFGFIKQSNGELTIESQAGAGTTVTIYLPRVAEPS